MSGFGAMMVSSYIPAVVASAGYASVYNPATSANNYLYGNFGGSNPVGTGAYTVEWWNYSTDTASNVRCLWDCRGTGGSSTDGFAIRQNSTADFYHIYSASTSVTFSGRTNNTWQHICVMRSGTTVYRFVDGVLKVSNTSGGTTNYTSNAWRVGTFMDDASTGSIMKGYMDEFRFSNTARYSTSGFTPPTTAFTSDANTILLLHFDGADNGTTFTDSSSNNRTVNRSGSVIVTSTAQVKITS